MVAGWGNTTECVSGEGSGLASLCSVWSQIESHRWTDIDWLLLVVQGMMTPLGEEVVLVLTEVWVAEEREQTEK